jgi:hypothetical protein
MPPKLAPSRRPDDDGRSLANIFLAVARIALRQADERGDDAFSEGREVLSALVGTPVRRPTPIRSGIIDPTE